MSGFEVAVGFLGAWAVQKVRRVAGRADAEVDRALDVAMDDLHELVSKRLREEPALRELTAEAEEAGTETAVLSDPVRQRMLRALQDAAAQDPGFAAELKRAVQCVQAAHDRVGGGATEESPRGVATNATFTLNVQNGTAIAMAKIVTVNNPSHSGRNQ